MDDSRTYLIELQGQLNESDLPPTGPLAMRWLHQETGSTTFIVHTDQSGLIGLLRHLHGRGLVLLSLQLEL